MPLIETDAFDIEFLSRLAERESWRKEIHRPIYHVHKWWAKRLGSIFRGVLLGCILDRDDGVSTNFYRRRAPSNVSVFDPFMGSGTTLGEAHKLGLTALGRDINPVAVRTARTAFGPLDKQRLLLAFRELDESVGTQIRSLYTSTDSQGRAATVLYYFWVMRAACPECLLGVDLFPNRIMARNAYPGRKPSVQVVCPRCEQVFPAPSATAPANCPRCQHNFMPMEGQAKGGSATCPHCSARFAILASVRTKEPTFRLYGKLILTRQHTKEYLAVTDADLTNFEQASTELASREHNLQIRLPTLSLTRGHNTNQAMNYGFLQWRDFFNDRQLLALGILRSGIEKLSDEGIRYPLLTLFSGVLEFNNMFASYKGEGTGAVRHMFSHHILKPERVPIEANIWGTPKSSGSFSGMFKTRLLRAIEYRQAPIELAPNGAHSLVASPPFTGEVLPWPEESEALMPRGIYVSCGDSSDSGLPNRSIDFVVTDPPFFDNVHYSELADFFHAWTQDDALSPESTRRSEEVQDTDAEGFSRKLQRVLEECHRVLKDDGLLVFSYHHSRADGWNAVAEAILKAGFIVVNAHPVKSEMSVATPKSQAKEPIQIDVILVCRKGTPTNAPPSIEDAGRSAATKTARLATFLNLSENDRKAICFGQGLTTLRSPEEILQLEQRAEDLLRTLQPIRPDPANPFQRAQEPELGPIQHRLFKDKPLSVEHTYAI